METDCRLGLLVVIGSEFSLQKGCNDQKVSVASNLEVVSLCWVQSHADSFSSQTSSSFRCCTKLRKSTLPLNDICVGVKGLAHLHPGVKSVDQEKLVGRSSPYYNDMWGRYCCLTSFFSDCRYMPWLRRYSPTKLCDGAQMASFCVMFASCIFSEPRAAHFRPAF